MSSVAAIAAAKAARKSFVHFMMLFAPGASSHDASCEAIRGPLLTPTGTCLSAGRLTWCCHIPLTVVILGTRRGRYSPNGSQDDKEIAPPPAGRARRVLLLGPPRRIAA